MITKDEFLKIHSIDEILWNQCASNPIYIEFNVKKSFKNYRLIEAPAKPLKMVQKILANYFNQQYKNYLPDCSYGYIPKWILTGEVRDIKSNALQHKDSHYLVNFDLENFFYQIDTEGVRNVCKKCNLEENLIEEIVNITTRFGRLPMGTPTSPVLSNLAALNLDESLMNYCISNKIIFTRYVDDLSFSSTVPIDSHINKIKKIILTHGWDINEKKTKQFDKGDRKSITGIDILNTELTVNIETLEKIRSNIDYYKKLKSTFHMLQMVSFENEERIKKIRKYLKSSISGQFQFVKRIEGEQSANYIKLESRYNKAEKTAEGFDYNVYI